MKPVKLIVCMFRFVGEDIEHKDWYGFAAAKTMTDLFWQIDQHGDPYRSEISKIDGASVCFRYGEVDHDEYGAHSYEISEQIDMACMLEAEREWYTPDWSRIRKDNK